MSAPQNAPAGWYPQPDGSQRYWDGYQWTEHVSPLSDPAETAGSADVPVRPWFKKKRVIIPTVALVFVVVIAALSNGNDTPGTPSAIQTPSPSPTVEATQGATPEPAEPEEAETDPVEEVDEEQDAEAEAPQEEETPARTVSQTQAIRSAESYLALTAFSRKGLISQLKYEGFSGSDAEFAIDHLDPDWAEQALRSAEDYLDFSAFSSKGLINQLEFEGYSTDDATYGVDNVEVDWMEQASLKAEEYLSFTSFSRSSLIDQLKFEGFSAEQAAHGADSVGL